MSNVVLSIDGTKETNDRMRYRVDGSGSYDTIVPKFQDLLKAEIKIITTFAVRLRRITWILQRT